MPFEDIPPAVRKRMSRIRKTGSTPEILVRRILHRLGYRFRINRADLPGTPDIVLPKHRAIIFVHGCFWHQHAGCRDATIPKVRQDYWLPKLAATVNRDRKAAAQLEGLGWKVLTLWGCELGNVRSVERALQTFLEG